MMLMAERYPSSRSHENLRSDIPLRQQFAADVESIDEICLDGKKDADHPRMARPVLATHPED